MTSKRIDASFRDPSGFLYLHDGVLLRQVNRVYKDDYDRLVQSGLLKSLVDKGWLIDHEELDLTLGFSPDAHKILKPHPLRFISYPYEWCFSQLQDAALLTLAIQKEALKHGMSLKDASAYNIQFMKGKPIFIDLLSFETLKKQKAWVAYRQYCQHFLAPLLLMSHKDVRLSQLLKGFIDGIPLDLTSSLLPYHTWARPSVLTHIHLHAWSQKRFSKMTVPEDDINGKENGKANIKAMGYIIESLERAVERLKWKVSGSAWGDYYKESSHYSSAAMSQKKAFVENAISLIAPKFVWDLGANTGFFSHLIASRGIETLAFDIDPACIEKNYHQCKRENITNVLPLTMDLTNPSPSIGWENNERKALANRGPADMIVALALIHHLGISNNVPLDRIAKYFSQLGRSLIIEFIPKSDSLAQTLLRSRTDIFSHYSENDFENAFAQYFDITDSVKIHDMERKLYLMIRK